MKNNLFDKFKPKESKFFPLLREMANVITSVGDLIIECMQATSHDQVVTIYKKIKDEEHRGDAIQNKIFTELNNTFIAPFDREDIDSLSSTMDDVADLVNKCAKRMMLYNPKAIPESANTLATFVRESGSYIEEAVVALADLKNNTEKLKGLCDKLNEVEGKADDVYEHFLIDLFENESDPFEVIKLKDILHELERATDAADRVGKIIRIILIKYT